MNKRRVSNHNDKYVIFYEFSRKEAPTDTDDA
jgi:hypothetical protein